MTVFNPDYPRAIWRCLVDGKDLQQIFNPRLRSLRVVECRGDEADQLDIVISDHDEAVELPELGVTMSVAIGWSDTGLIEKGDFVIDEISYLGSPDEITLRGRSADLTGPLRTRTERSFHKKTIAEIVREIAAANSLDAVVDKRFDALTVQHIDQTNESDVAFLNRLGKRYDAVATVKEGKLVFLSIIGQKTATGEEMPTITLVRSDGDKHEFQQVSRDAYSGVRAFWLDTRQSRRRSVVVGVVGNARQLRETYANEADALAAARSEWQRIRRGTSTMRYSLAISKPELSPQYKIKFQQWKQQITSLEWLVEKVTHSLDGDGGLRCDLELEVVDNSTF